MILEKCLLKIIQKLFILFQNKVEQNTFEKEKIMKKRFLLGAALTVVASLGVISAATLTNRVDGNTKAGVVMYTGVLDNSNAVENAEYAISSTVEADFAKFSYYLAKTSETGHVVLAPHGVMFNYDSSGAMGAIHNIRGLKATYTSTGSLKMRVMTDNDGKVDAGQLIDVPSGADIDLSGVDPYYIRFEADDAEVDIASIEFEYTCTDNENRTNPDLLVNTFTGMLGDIAYKVTLDDEGGARIETLNKPASQDVFTGVWAFANGKVTVTIAGTYVVEFAVSSDFVSLTVNPEVGIGATYSGLTVTRVFNIEDYERFTTTGNGADQSHSLYAMSGLRSLYHADYYATGHTSLFGDKNWSFMGSSDYLQLGTTGGVDGNYAIFKSNSNGLRYVNFNSFMKSNMVMGKGSTFSFWAHGAMTSGGASNGKDTSIKVRLFYKSGITACSDSTGVATTVTIPADSDWAQYEIPLDTSKQFYGYSFYFSNSATGYVPIDNIQMYDVNPNLTYVEPEALLVQNTYHTVASVPAVSATYSVIMAIGNNGVASVRVGGGDAVATGYTYNSVSGDIEITTTGSLHIEQYSLELSFGKITASFDVNAGTLKAVSFDGGVAPYIENNGTMTATRGSFVWNCEGTTDDLLRDFRRRYDNGGGWQFDTGNTDRIVANTDAVEGEKSLKFRCLGDGNTSHKTALTLAADKDMSGCSNFGFWFKNTSNYSLTLRLFAYTSANYATNIEFAQKVVEANSDWVFITSGIANASHVVPANIYNFQIFIGVPSTSCTANFYPLFDNISLW